MFILSRFLCAKNSQQQQEIKLNQATISSADVVVEEVVPEQGAGLNVGRNIMLDRAEKVIGHQFFPLQSTHGKFNQSPKVRALTDTALLRYVLFSQTKGLLSANKLAFFNIASFSLTNPLLDKVAPDNIVLVVDVIELNVDWDSLNQRLKELSAKGFQLGLTIREDIDAVPPITTHMHYIVADVATFIGLDLRMLINNIYAKPYITMDTQLIAANIQSHEDFQFCYKVGFHCFDGPFISNKEVTHTVKNEVNSTIVFSVLQMLRNERAFDEIAKEIKNEPTVTYKLLRYVNSAAMGLSKPINSLTEALLLVGQEKLYRWISLLLFDFVRSGYYENFLVEQALTRARTLELLSGKGRVPNEPDKLFLVGLFSLLDQVLGQPLAELIEKASLPQDVRDTLMSQSGPYVDVLQLVALGEANAYTDDLHYKTALVCCDLTDTEYATASLSAVVWADEALSHDDQ